MNKVTLYLLSVLLLSFNLLFSQHPVFEHLTEKDGLPDIEFYDVLEDVKGYVWLAANKGLFRYNGKEFKSYTNPDKRGLSVFNLKVDSKGRVWCNNITGQFFYVEDDKLHLFDDFKTEVDGQLASYVLKSDTLIVGATKGVFKVSINSINKAKKYLTKEGLNYLTSKNDKIILFENYEVYNLSKEKSKLYDFIQYKKYDYHKWVASFFKNKTLWYAYGTNKRNVKNQVFYKTNKDINKSVELLGIKNKNIIIGFYEIDNDLWVCTYNGVYIYEYKKGKFNYKKILFKEKEITKVLKDRNDNYWFTTLRDGVFIIPNINIEKYDLKQEQSNISAMKKIGENQLMFGTTKGDIVLVKTTSNSLSFIKRKDREKVFSICSDSNNTYLSLASSSLMYNKKDQKIYENNYYNNAKDLTLVSDNRIVYALYSSANLISLANEAEKVLKNKRSYTVYYSKAKNEIYVGYVDGVEKYSESLNSKPILFNEKPIFAIDIDETLDGTIWISTFKDGVIGIKKNGNIINLTEKYGLLSNRTGKIKGDKNTLWIVTDKGVQLFNVKSREFKNITQKDGISSFNISGISTFEKDVFLSSNKGLYKIAKEKVFNSRKLSEFYFTKILVNGEEVKIKKEYSLSPNTSKIQFNFHTNGYLAEDNLEYRYRLLNSSEKWNKVSKGINELVFNNLAGGAYTFQLKAIEVNGKRETPIKSVKITIKIPFYKKWWFIISFFLGLVLFLWFYFIQRIKRLRNKQEQDLEKERMQKQLVSSKLESLQAQMNPHFTFNALNSIQNLVLRGDKIEAYNYLTKFSFLIRENLNMTKRSFVSFQEELKLLKKYLELEKLRFREEFFYEIKGVGNIKEMQIPTMIIQPYVENSIKHGLFHKKDPNKKIILDFYQEKATLKCVIYDNGIGIEASKKIKIEDDIKRESFSTKAIKERLLMLKKYYNTDIGVTYEKVKEGTKVVIKIPYTVD